VSASSERFIKQARGLPEAYLHAITVGQRGAVTLGGETIDEASRKIAQAIVARSNAAGFIRANR
jgi:citrate lyase subunit beta/citryl-CoA lyase